MDRPVYGFYPHLNQLRKPAPEPQAAPRGALAKALAPSYEPEGDPLAGMSPIDKWKLDIEMRNAAAANATPEERAKNAETNLAAALSVIPGPANVLSAKDAYDSAGTAYNEFSQGNLGRGALASALAGLGGLGAVTGIGFGRPAAKVAGRTVFSGVGPVANDLPMDEASRMARAKDMGFDTDTKWYHGTAGDHTAFDNYYSGSVSSGDGRGFWFTKSPGYAWEYAQNAAGKRGEPERMIEAYLGPKRPLTLEFDGQGRPLANGDIMPFESNAEVIDYARSNGYDAIHWPTGSFTDEAAMTLFDPSHIRDTTAAFDPARQKSSNILAGLAAAGLIPSYLMLDDSTSRPE